MPKRPSEARDRRALENALKPIIAAPPELLQVNRKGLPKPVAQARNGRDSGGQRLGMKLFGGEQAIAGNIIARQRGTQWHPGTNVGIGKDHTLYAKTTGTVQFLVKGAEQRKYVSIVPAA